MSFSFSYSIDPYFLPTNSTISISPSFFGSQPPRTTYSITPLNTFNNTKLNLNANNGTISGTTYLISISQMTTYTVTAKQLQSGVEVVLGTATIVISIQYNPIFSYLQSSYIIEKNTQVNIIAVPAISDIIGVTYSLLSSTPSYPSLSDISLNLNTSTGLISGTPLITSYPTTYVIRANNNGVVYDTSLNISVQTLPTIGYPQSSYTLTQNIPVKILPIVQDQLNVTYSITGCYLPFGIEFNTTTGEISGSPTILTTFRNYTITITNSIGSANTNLRLNVIRTFLAPTVLADNFSSNSFLTDPILAMRRKAEILKYKKNSSNLTSQQYYALLAKGNGPYAKRAWGTQGVAYTDPNSSNLPLVGNTIVCNTGIICSPTSSSDVPGPVMNLCYNPAVPLIGYKEPNRFRTNIGFKWPFYSWQQGDNGFPNGKAGNG